MEQYNPTIASPPRRSPQLRPARGLGVHWLLGAFIVLAFIMTSSAFYFVFTGPPQIAPEAEVTARGNPAYIALWGSVYLMTLGALVLSIMRTGVHRAIFYTAPIVVLVFASMTWSVSSVSTGFYGLMFTFNILLGYVLSQLAPPRLFLSVLARTLIVLLIASLVLFFTVPHLVSVDRYGGGWLSSSQLYGVFAHKSDAGYYFALLIVLMSRGRVLGISRPVRYTAIAVAFYAIILTNSATALVAAVLVSGLIWLFRDATPSAALALALASAAAIILSVCMPLIDIGPLSSLLGRDADLTGRGEIWSLSVRYIEQRPMLGYGYYGFFNKDVFSPVWSLYENFKYFFTPHFHNSAIDVTISLGLTGFVLYIAYLGFAFAVGANTSIDLTTRRLFVGVMMLFTITTCFDFTLMKHNSFATAIMFYCFFAGQTRYAAEGAR